jgi:nicotinamide-nucleotide amidase
VARPRAVIVATGSELVRGDRNDLNGPFLAREALKLGLEPARIIVVGDDPSELEAALREGFAADACLVSGGLGPTHDDRTVELVARAAGVGLRVDPELAREIESFSRSIAERLNRPYGEFAPGVRKQATLPEGALPIGLAGTAPGLVLETAGAVVAVLPGPPPELRRLWPAAVASEPFGRLLARTRPPGRRVLRFFGASESAVAQALAGAGGEPDGVEVTICARDFEIHVDLVVEPGVEKEADELERRLVAPVEPWLFARDEEPVEAHVLALCRARGLRLAAAESCTGGLVAARLTGIPGASDVFVGGIVAYSNAVKETELCVPHEVLERHGAVSAETAASMARGVRERLGADVAVSVTGVAGPGGGTAAKPVGLVHLHATAPDGERAQQLVLPGDRDAVRQRATALALHLLRRLLSQSRHEAA